MKRILIILLAAFGIVAAGAVVAVLFLDIDLKKVMAQDEKEPTAEELAARSYSMESLTTNLSSDHFAIVQLNLLEDNEKSYKELEIRNPDCVFWSKVSLRSIMILISSPLLSSILLQKTNGILRRSSFISKVSQSLTSRGY
ncbi:hypothetical protein ABFG93_12410 [Pseudalkalibacillus hwajinpoensis]